MMIRFVQTFVQPTTAVVKSHLLFYTRFIKYVDVYGMYFCL